MKAGYIDLLNRLEMMESVVVAFSGGVDSTFLLYACKQALGDKVVAVTIDSPYIPRWEIEESRGLVEQIGVKHKIIKKDIPDNIINNPKDRCYLCKKQIFSEIMKYKEELGYNYLLDGSNLDDTKDYRPGMIALKELEVRSPLLESGLTKADIREISKQQKIQTWNKPAYACLLSRIPYDSIITDEELRRIEKSEKYLMDRGFKAVRVRSFGDTAKIEIAKEDMKRFINYDTVNEVNEELIRYGYHTVTFDMGGYAMGKMNKDIEETMDE